MHKCTFEILDFIIITIFRLKTEPSRLCDVKQENSEKIYHAIIEIEFSLCFDIDYPFQFFDSQSF